MAVDEAILRGVTEQTSPPTVRVFGWSRPAITLGFAQRPESVLDILGCERDGIPFTRRPTGGRALYHDREIAYSVTGLVTDPQLGGDVLTTYRAIGRILRDALIELGFDAVVSKTKPATTQASTGNPRPCFASVSRYELTVSGRKVVGSSQRRFRDAFLQQGSILAGPGYEAICRYSAGESGDVHGGFLASHAADLSTLRGGYIDEKDVSAALHRAFFSVLNIADGELNENERNLSLILEREQYGSKGWVMHNAR